MIFIGIGLVALAFMILGAVCYEISDLDVFNAMMAISFIVFILNVVAGCLFAGYVVIAQSLGA